MRERLLAAGRGAFSRAGFDQLGVRDLAAAAGVDAAIVIRAFGSKEALFAAISEEAFTLGAPFEGPLSSLGQRVARHLTAKGMDRGPDQLDAFQFLVRSAASPTAAPILSAALHKGFIAPLARLLGGPDASMRAALMTACVLGFATLRGTLGSNGLESGSRAKLIERLGAVLQACVNAKPLGNAS
jgi:AcrR family transcriptional regulator